MEYNNNIRDVKNAEGFQQIKKSIGRYRIYHAAHLIYRSIINPDEVIRIFFLISERIFIFVTPRIKHDSSASEKDGHNFS